ncbi:hypothetical protein HID58_090087 [Brassica napus]|uniref:Uncharacterized protein n=1 Tax=Brassica napus TaxID=3708 RepID=A0ABQ7XFT5_BRANA|nr:hypothetical protein HID58_090087 [Brassica napus]
MFRFESLLGHPAQHPARKVEVSACDTRLTCELSQEARDFTAEDNRRKECGAVGGKKAAAMEERKRMKAAISLASLKHFYLPVVSEFTGVLCLIVDTVGPDLHGINILRSYCSSEEASSEVLPVIYCQRKLEDHQPPPLLQIEFKTVVVDRCSGGGDGERSAGEEGARSMIIE